MCTLHTHPHSRGLTDSEGNVKGVVEMRGGMEDQIKYSVFLIVK